MKNEIALYNKDDAFKIAERLIDNGYVVMLSTEEQLYVINYLNGEWQDYLNRVVSDRNAVVFMPREEYDCMDVEIKDERVDELLDTIKELSAIDQPANQKELCEYLLNLAETIGLTKN